MAYEKLKEDHYRNLGGINTKLSEFNTENTQFLDLRNYCFYKAGAISNRPGQEVFASLPIATYPVKPATTIEYIKNSGATFVVYDSGNTLYTLPSTAVGFSLAVGSSPVPIDYSIQNDVLYYANGNAFFLFNGTYNVFYRSETTRFDINGGTFNTSLVASGVTHTINPGGYYFFLTPVRGLLGESFNTQYGLPGFGSVYPTAIGVASGFGVCVTLSATVISKGKWVLYGFTVPTGFGYSGVMVQYQKGTSLQEAPYTYEILNTLKSEVPSYTFNVSTFGTGTTYFGVEFDHYTLSASWENQYQFTLMPRFLETYNNMLFMAGFSSQPNHVYMSEIGEPERLKEDSFFEIRTGDNKEITGCVFFQDALIFFKRNSIHEVTGTSPTDLYLKTINEQYGSLNNEGIVVFEDRLWFVDDRGICEYNAANIEIKSEPIKSYLDLVDKSKIKAFHYKDRSEVWFCASNYCFTFNYFLNAWSINDPIPIDNVSGANVLPFGVSTVDPAYWRQGTSFYNLVKFNPTLAQDFGSDITLVAKTKFHKRLGDSTQELWRRFYLDAQTSVTLNATLSLYADYGSSVVARSTVSLSSFQARVDFGVSAKSLAVEFIIKTGSAITVNGYTIESRYLRSV